MTGSRYETGQERWLFELMHAAVRDVPPPSFDEHDIVAAGESSKRRYRRRTVWAACSAIAVAIAVAVGVVIPTLQRNGDAPSPAASGLGGAGSTSRSGSGAAHPMLAAPQSGTVAGGCTSVDTRLAAALAGELGPAAHGAPRAVPRADRGHCGGSGNGAAIPVDGGWVVAMLLPSGTDASWAPRPRDVRITASGRQLVVFMRAAGVGSATTTGTGPAARLPTIAGNLAPHF